MKDAPTHIPMTFNEIPDIHAAKTTDQRGRFPGSRFLSRARLLVAGMVLLAAGNAARAVVATLTPTSITQTATSTLQITGLTAGASAQVERWVDSNGNGAVDAGEPLAEVVTVTDGQWPSIGGVRDTNQAGDADGLANGEISVALSPGAGVELGRVAGSQLVRVSSPTAAFTALAQTLTVTQAAQAQTISGNVTNGASPVPFASVAAFADHPDDDGDMVGGAVANAAGAYALSLPAGSYRLAVFKAGVVGGFGTSGVVTLGAGSSVTHHLSVVTATRTISGKFSDSVTGAGLGGIQLFIGTEAGLAVILSTGLDGTYTAQVTADNWGVESASSSFARLGYLEPAPNGPDGFELNADTLASPVTGLNAAAEKATALLYGRVTGPGSIPVAGLWMSANDMTDRDSESMTDANGDFVIGVLAGDWNLSVSWDSPALAGYLPPNGVSLTVTAGQALERNFSLTAVNAHLQGTVTRDGVPVAGLRMGAYNQATNNFITTDTAVNGTFDLGLTSGTWQLQLESQSAEEFGLVGPTTSFTLAVNQTIGGISFAVKGTTASITGTVRNDSNQPVAQASVSGSATVGGVGYVSHTSTDSGGNYSLPVIDGTWQVNASSFGFNFPPSVEIVVAGSTVVRNFTLTKKPVFNFHPSDQNVSAGQTFVFSVNANSEGQISYLWQVSTNGGTDWADLSNNATYGTVDEPVLNVTANAGLNGYRYRCVATNTFGSTNSNPALLTVGAVGTIPVIQNEPAAASTTPGISATFEVTTTGSPSPSYLWQLSTDNGFSWNNLSDGAGHSGVTGPILAVLAPTLAQNGHRYRVIVTNTAGSDTSLHALLTVTGTTPYEQWLQANFTSAQLANEAVSGPLATPAGDGVANLYKYAFNLTALSPGYGGTLTAPLLSGGNLVLVFPATRNELTYQVKASTDLVTWTATGVVTQVNGTIRTATHPAGSGRLFLRIFVTQP